MSEVILTAYLTHVDDPQRGFRWQEDITSLDPLIESLNGLKLVVFTNLDISSDKFETVKVSKLNNPYHGRWLAYSDYLKEHSYDKVFCVDATDVVMLKNPFPLMDDKHIYVGDEAVKIGDPWMAKMQPYLAGVLNPELQILNIGLLGGNQELITELLDDFKKLMWIFQEKIGKVEMAAFNFLLYSKYKDIIVHGAPVNTQFNKNDMKTDAWFRHK